ncbi:MAG: hypothetical protein U9N14_07740, partial [Pseudomonadota bacterium]|nr:hypothetical protein [Pseudomonadota bacterium]
MKRLFALFVCLAAFGLSLTLPFAQAVADDPVLSSERIDGLISMIENEGERTVFVERLKVLTALDDTTEPVTGFTERARMVVTESLTAVGSRLEHATKAMTDLPATVRELVGALSEKEMLIALGLALAVSLGLLGIGAMAGMIVSFSYARLPMSGKGAVRYAFRRFLACLFGLAVFYLIVVGGAIVAFQVMGERPEAFAFMIAIVHSMVLVGLVIALTRAILAPDGKGPRLPKLTDETAAYMQIWVRRFVLVWLLGVIMVSTVRLPIDLT